MNPFSKLIVSTLLGGVCLGAMAQDKVINLYSARHYPTDEALRPPASRSTV